MQINIENIVLFSCFLLIPVNVCSLTDNYDDLLPVNNAETGDFPSIGSSETDTRSVKREAPMFNVIMDLFDTFYMAKKVYGKRSKLRQTSMHNDHDASFLK
ncbi:uncharacterized protein LOC116339412 [Contarinia nasturtii]|uniref:uncharacterized protein LOC116339412 n=1 Tax=Contarinia nasturtii TaxID=265458 RepID=UPI0012D43703|nr:uncharacterized protein LOC116339412 [Contarinia nasturtii]